MRPGVRKALLTVATAVSPEQQIASVVESLRRLGLHDLVEIIASEYAVSVDDIASRSRRKSISAARHVCWRAIKEVHGKSSPEIGAIWGVDHTSVLHGISCARARAQKREVANAA